jgi:hypothetical protein
MSPHPLDRILDELRRELIQRRLDAKWPCSPKLTEQDLDDIEAEAAAMERDDAL